MWKKNILKILSIHYYFKNVSYVTLTFVKISSKKKDQGKINDS